MKISIEQEAMNLHSYGIEAEVQANISVAISLKRIADALELLTYDKAQVIRDKEFVHPKNGLALLRWLVENVSDDPGWRMDPHWYLAVKYVEELLK